MTAAAFIFPIPLIALAVKDSLTYDTLFKFIILYGHTLLLTPVLCIAASILIYMERDNYTLKNLLSIPVSRNKLILAKLIILLMLSICYSVGAFLASVVGATLAAAEVNMIYEKLLYCLLAGILTFVTTLPCIILIIVFGKNHIISILLSFFYAIGGFLIALSDVSSRSINAQTIMPASVVIRWIIPKLSQNIEIDSNVINRFAISNLQCGIIMAVTLIISIPAIYKLFQNQES